MRLDDEPSAIELAKELQENLPQEKIKGCPIKAFQAYALGVRLERYDWAEQLTERLAPPSRVLG